MIHHQPNKPLAANPPASTVTSARLRVLCVLPAYNEAGKVGQVVTKIIATDQVEHVVVVDDCSTDTTGEEARAAGATVIRHERNMGVGAGIRTGLFYAKDCGFAAAVIMSSDGQHEPTELGPVIKKLSENKTYFIQGSRRLQGGKTVDAPLFREVTTRLFSFVFTLFTWQKITDGTNGFRAFYLSLLDDPKINLNQDWLNTYELEPYLLYKAVQSPRVHVIEFPITIYYPGGRKQYSKMKPVRDWWRLVRPLFFLRFGLKK